MSTTLSRFLLSQTFLAKLLLMTAILAGGASNAFGVQFLCVSSATELQKALTDSSDNGQYAGQDVEIFIAAGTYMTGAATSNGPFHYRSTANTGYLSMFGTACGMGSNFNYDARQVVLDGKNKTQVLNIQSASRNVFLLALTIQNGESTVAGGGLAVNTNVAGGDVQLTNLIFRGNHTSSIGGGFAIDGSGLKVFSSLIVENSADGGYGGGFEYSRNGPYAEFYRSTVANNTTSAMGGTGGLYCCGSPTISPSIASSIFWSNTNFGLEFAGPTPLLNYDDYGTVTGVNDYSESMDMQVDPKFVGVGDDAYKLKSGSPLLAMLPASQFNVQFDVDGNAAPTLGFADIGAYEDTVFTGDFEAH